MVGKFLFKCLGTLNCNSEINFKCKWFLNPNTSLIVLRHTYGQYLIYFKGFENQYYIMVHRKNFISYLESNLLYSFFYP